MPFPLIFGILAGVAAAAIGTVAVLANWDEIVDWFKKEFLPTLEELWNKVKSDVIHAAKVFVDKVLEKGEWLVEFIHKLYYKELKLPRSRKWPQALPRIACTICPAPKIPFNLPPALGQRPF